MAHRIWILAVLFCSACSRAPAPPPETTLATRTAELRKIDGFFALYWDEKAGKLWLEIDRFDEEFLYQGSLAAGVGSNDIGLDRGQLGATRVVHFERVGPKVLLVQPNYRYRAGSENPDERRAVAEAFARSVLWGFEVEAEGDGSVLVDATGFVVRDVHDVVGHLDRASQGRYKLDASRSAPYLPNTRGFPRNTEMEATLTFTTSGRPGAWVSSVTPTARVVTVRQRHSFVALPEDGYRPRRAHPSAGYATVAYDDYAVPLGQPLRQQLIRRHRLQKGEPIVYHVDRGAPEPIRSALIEGASWWNQAFLAAGHKDAFLVKLMPEGADPLDVRYNVIQWVHRSTRGWSYGGSVTDPRTGEILKGHVTLGSLRVRQDYLLAEGLLAPYEKGDEVSDAAREMALARIRQLSAHEVGHTLGLRHNYLASTKDRASVMDYPHPLVRLTADGAVDLSDAYAKGIGAWDKVAIDYGYRDFPEGTDEAAALAAILADARKRGIFYLTDRDARPAGSAHPRTHLWDNGVDAAAELKRMLAVRAAALDRFGARAIKNGMPLAAMEEALLPLYLHHRYQLEAVAKVVGGVYYTYALRGDGQEPLRAAPAGEQEDALETLLSTLTPEVLALPEKVLRKLPPRPDNYPPHRELFARHTGLVFDAVAPAAVAANLTVAMILQPERAARLVQQHALDPSLPSLEYVVGRLRGHAFGMEASNGYEAEIKRIVERVVVERLQQLARSAPMPQVRAVATLELEHLAGVLQQRSTLADTKPADRAHFRYLARGIGRFLETPAAPTAEPARLPAPPGSPIGCR